MIRIRFDGRSVDRFLSARLTGLPWLCVEYSPSPARYPLSVTMEDATPLTRRERRARAAEPRERMGTGTAETEIAPRLGAAPGGDRAGRVALAWVDPDALSEQPRPSGPGVDLLPPLRRARRSVDPRIVLIPALAVLVLAVAYVASMLLWPLSAVAPAVTAAEVTALRGAESAVDFPADGAGAVAVEGFSPASSTTEPVQMASLTKLVTALVVLDRAPLEAGEQGPSYDFTFADRSEYWRYVADNQSALNVPDGGALTEYQMLQGVLIASASNYADRLVTEIYGSVDDYTTAANAWLADNEIEGVTVTDASGFDRGNVATPAALIELGERALEHPVIAEIVRTPSAELPGAGEIENTNALLGEDGVIGLKTGSYFANYNLLAARTTPAGEEEITVLAAVTGQPTDALRVEEAADLLDQVVAEAGTVSTLAAGTVVGNVTTAWGAASPVVTDDDASLLLWNAATAESAASFDLGDTLPAGADAGVLTLTGPADTVEVGVSLERAVPGPDMWWRLTHPLELLGIAD